MTRRRKGKQMKKMEQVTLQASLYKEKIKVKET